MPPSSGAATAAVPRRAGCRTATTSAAACSSWSATSTQTRRRARSIHCPPCAPDAYLAAHHHERCGMYLDRVSTRRATPGSQTSLREANRARIVDAVKRHGGLTQVELAGATGLSPATVSNIVKELSLSGVLNTTPSTRSGRRAQHVTLARALGLVAGVHFSTRHLRVALADVAHTVVAEHHLPLAKRSE